MALSLRGRLRQINRAGAYSAEESARLLLDERTLDLASRQSSAKEPERPAAPVLVCTAGRERYGIALADIVEVLPVRPCVPVPDGPSALVGIIGRRGYLVSVIDLGAALGIPAPAETEFHHLVLLRREQPRVALRVEHAEGVFPATPISSENQHAFRTEAVIGYAEMASGSARGARVLSLLDVDQLIRPFLFPFPASGV
ncbi:chemotaxis protein CheW [Microvirga antarctica]|uniref:chemotaxis protein CheW n=1 Tax=Microvirga antarctica TaxID=2819233 RepID=UPI001B315F2F|nr:chemotaxis protein CheW [Microvirga antarctica]